MDRIKKKYAARDKRKQRVRKKVMGTSQSLRLSVFKSLYHIYAHIIDDEKAATLLAVSDAHIKGKHTKSEVAKMVGLELAKKAKGLGVESIVFDRGGFRYHGRVKQIAEGAREGGLIF